MARFESRPPVARRGMCDCSSRIIDEWSLGRFAEGVDVALELSRRPTRGGCIRSGHTILEGADLRQLS